MAIWPARLWEVNDDLTAARMNEIRAQLTHLYGGRVIGWVQSNTQTATTATWFVDVDPSRLSISVLATSTRVMVLGFMLLETINAVNQYGHLRIAEVGWGVGASVEVRIGQSETLFLSAVLMLSGLTVGLTYTYRLQYAAGTNTIYGVRNSLGTKWGAWMVAVEL